jgi:dethiobiotin synthetase
MAADALGAPAFTIGDLVAELRWPDDVGVGFVETAGGIRSPLAADGDNVALVDAIEPALALLVADAGLGTINLVRLAVDALRTRPVLVVLNRYDGDVDLHVRNRRWLAERDGLEVVVDVPDLADRVERSMIGG